jgi:hypothetical protein
MSSESARTALTAATIFGHQRASRRSLTGRFEGRIRCNVTLIWDDPCRGQGLVKRTAILRSETGATARAPKTDARAVRPERWPMARRVPFVFSRP